MTAESIGIRTRSDRTVFVVGMSVALAVGVVAVLALGAHLVDDAFISMRYASNFAHGRGLVFNPGHRVEGFSNPLWTLLLSGADRISLPLPWVALVLGALAFLGTIPLTALLARRLGARPVVAVGAALIVAASTNMIGSSTNGLETALVGLALTGAMLGATRSPLQPWALAAWLIVVAFSRPEGPFLSVTTLLVTYLARRVYGLGTERLNATVITVIGTIVVGGLLRVAYYGELLPMSVTAKRSLDTNPLSAAARNAQDGLSYIPRSFGWAWIVIALGAAGVVAVLWRPRTGEARALVVLIVTTVAFGVFVAVSNGGDWMAFGRLLVPYLPMTVAVIATGLGELAPRPYVLLGWAAIAIACQPLGILHNRWEPVHRVNDDVGNQLAMAARPGDEVTTNVLGHLGYSGISLQLFDFHGLIEPSIAKLKQPGDSYGKYGVQQAARRGDPVILMNQWQLLNKVVAAGHNNYLVVTSRKLVHNNVFLVVRADEVQRFAPRLRKGLHARVVSLAAATAYWNREAPGGQSEERR